MSKPGTASVPCPRASQSVHVGPVVRDYLQLHADAGSRCVETCSIGEIREDRKLRAEFEITELRDLNTLAPIGPVRPVTPNSTKLAVGRQGMACRGKKLTSSSGYDSLPSICFTMS